MFQTPLSALGAAFGLLGPKSWRTRQYGNIHSCDIYRDYFLRLGIGEEKRYQGTYGRLYIYSFFSLVDLVSIVPFYIDLLYVGDLPASQFHGCFDSFA